MSVETAEHTLQLSRGRVLKVVQRGEYVDCELTHSLRSKRTGMTWVVDQSYAMDLENALLSVLNLDYPNGDSRSIAELIRATEWGARLP